MKLSKLYLIAVLVGTMAVIGCTTEGGDGAAGTGGDGAAGTGGDGAAGTGGDGGAGGAPNPDVLCDVDVCATNPTAKTMCVEGVQNCIALDVNVDECIAAVVLENCNVTQ